MTTAKEAVMVIDEPPPVSRRRIRNHLRTLRQDRGETQQEVANKFGWSSAKVMRIENGRSLVSISDLTALLSHFGTTNPPDVERWQAVARNAKQPGPAKKYGSALTPKFLEYLEYEENAANIWSYQMDLVPGPLQIEDYARAALTLYMGPDREKDLDLRIRARLERKELLRQDDGPKATFIVDEAALHRRVTWQGGDVMERQLVHLQEMSRLPTVDIHVIPFSVGLYSASRVPFVVLDSGDESESRMVYLETHEGEVIHYDTSATLETYVALFDRMRRLGTEADRFPELIDSVLKSPGSLLKT